ncbi:GGDEF domain-containing protein [Aliamphritea hakodatensis]|uniref:GGDEF domain-containing protein n=1 Tax=Aliamphritea hakodatensis TaxID=2895352 RepID=UPI0022FD3793|nr:diguanylate cyclase [Aliamphritea hakodatensis]
MSSKQNEWKDKYKELALEMDELQAQLEDRSLSRLTTQMAVHLTGVTPKLDTALLQLTEELKANQQQEGYQVALDAVDKELRGVDQAQQKTDGDLLKVLREWLRQINDNLAADQNNAQLDNIGEMIPQAVERKAALPGIMQDLLELQQPLLKSVDTAVVPAASAESQDSDELNDLYKQVEMELVTLIKSLYIPKSDQPDAKALIKQIRSGVSLKGLSDIFQNLTQLIVSVASRSSSDFEDYLVNLNSQLSEVQIFLTESHKDEVANGKETDQLNTLIRRDVKAIHQAVTDSSDINQLKLQVSSQLKSIVKSMDDFRSHEEAREKALEERYVAMNDRLQQMETESMQVRARIEAERTKAMTDPLTMLPNRAAYDEKIAAEFERWKRYQQFFSVAVCDLDFFKKVNDTYGHLAGDKVLRLVANILTNKCRSTDFVTRFGGEEFVILMPSTTSAEAAQAVDKIRHSIENSPFNFHGKSVTITMSFGVAEIEDADSIESLFNRADKALYTAKKNGRNRVEVA